MQAISFHGGQEGGVAHPLEEIRVEVLLAMLMRCGVSTQKWYGMALGAPKKVRRWRSSSRASLCTARATWSGHVSRTL